MSKHQNLQSLSSNQLKAMLRQLQSQHDILQAKNQQMSNHINDMRNLVKKVESQRGQQLHFMLNKKDKLGNQIESLKEALKVCNNSNIKKYQKMLAFKILNEGK